MFELLVTEILLIIKLLTYFVFYHADNDAPSETLATTATINSLNDN